MRALDLLTSAANWIASFWVFCLAWIIFVDVAARVFFNAPFHGVVELITISLPAMFWLMMAYTLRTGGHLRSSILLSRMPPMGQRVIVVLNSLAGAGLLGLVAWLGYSDLVRSWTTNAFVGEDPLRVPTWPVWTCLVVGSGLASVQFVADAIRFAVYGAPLADEMT